MKQIALLIILFNFVFVKTSCMSLFKTDEDNFLKAIKDGSLGKVQKMVEQGQTVRFKTRKEAKHMVPTQYSFVISKDAVRSITPLMYAAKYDRADVIEFLINKGLYVNEITDFSALHVAAWYGNVEAAAQLIKLGAHAHAKVSGMTPLMLAAENKKPEMIKLLLASKPTLQTIGDAIKIAQNDVVRDLLTSAEQEAKQKALAEKKEEDDIHSVQPVQNASEMVSVPASLSIPSAPISEEPCAYAWADSEIHEEAPPAYQSPRSAEAQRSLY